MGVLDLRREEKLSEKSLKEIVQFVVKQLFELVTNPIRSLIKRKRTWTL